MYNMREKINFRILIATNILFILSHLCSLTFAQDKYVSETIPADWNKTALSKILTDEDFVVDNPNLQSTGYQKRKELDYWARNEIDFSLRLSAKVNFSAILDDKEYPFSIKFSSPNSATIITSPIFAGTKYKSGIKVLNKGESIRTLFPAVDYVNFFWGTPSYKNEDINYIGVGCLIDPSNKREFKLTSVEFSATGDVNASYYARKKKGYSEASFLPFLNLYSSKLPTDSFFSMNPAVSLKYQPVEDALIKASKENDNKNNDNMNKNIFKAELPVKIVFHAGFGEFREQERREYLVVNKVELSKDDIDLFKEAFSEEKLGEKPFCFGVIRGNVDKIRYETKN